MPTNIVSRTAFYWFLSVKMKSFRVIELVPLIYTVYI
jgi:hypothetical protein